MSAFEGTPLPSLSADVINESPLGENPLCCSNKSLERNGLREGPAAAAAVGFLLDVAVDVEVAARLCDGRHGDVLVGLPQEASSAVRE